VLDAIIVMTVEKITLALLSPSSSIARSLAAPSTLFDSRDEGDIEEEVLSFPLNLSSSIAMSKHCNALSRYGTFLNGLLTRKQTCDISVDCFRKIGGSTVTVSDYLVKRKTSRKRLRNARRVTANDGQ